MRAHPRRASISTRSAARSTSRSSSSAARRTGASSCGSTARGFAADSPARRLTWVSRLATRGRSTPLRSPASTFTMSRRGLRLHCRTKAHAPQWSTTHPALFANVDGVGRVDIWNINADTEVLLRPPWRSLTRPGRCPLCAPQWPRRRRSTASSSTRRATRLARAPSTAAFSSSSSARCRPRAARLRRQRFLAEAARAARG